MRMTEAVQEFIKDIGNARSKGTARAYGGHLRWLPAFATRDAVTEMGAPLLRAFCAKLVEARLSLNTLSAASTAMSQFCKWGIRRGLWLQNPMLDPFFRFQKPDLMPTPFDADEAGRLMALPLRGIERPVRDVFYFTGIRVTPLTQIRLCDVSFARVRIGELEAAGTIRTINKGNRALQVYIVPDLKPVLEEWMAQRKAEQAQHYDAFFATSARYGGGAISRSTVERWVRLWGAAAQVLHAHPHRFRHTYATDLLNAGVRIEDIQKLLGHSSIHTTQAYLKVAAAAVLGAALQRRRPVEQSACPPPTPPVAGVATLASDA